MGCTSSRDSSDRTTIGMEQRLKALQDKIKVYPDFPKPGVQFSDIFSILRDPVAFKELNKLMAEYVRTNFPGVEALVGLEARGFIFASTLAIELGLPFVPIRKPGKLPGELVRVEYTKEYGTDVFEMQKDSIKLGQKVLIVDDFLATGGSLAAAAQLLDKVGANILGSFVVGELTELNGQRNVPHTVHSLLKI